MKIGQYCQRQRCKHVESEQFWHAFASRGFVSDSWAFLLLLRRAFAVAGPTVWNSLSDDMCDSTLSTNSFRCLLKTWLFSEYIQCFRGIAQFMCCRNSRLTDLGTTPRDHLLDHMRFTDLSSRAGKDSLIYYCHQAYGYLQTNVCT